MNPCIIGFRCRSGGYKHGDIFRYHKGGVICSTCWEKMEGEC